MEASDDEVVEAGDKDDEEPEVVGGEPESGHESSNDPEVWTLQPVSLLHTKLTS